MDKTKKGTKKDDRGHRKDFSVRSSVQLPSDPNEWFVWATVKQVFMSDTTTTYTSKIVTELKPLLDVKNDTLLSTSCKSLLDTLDSYDRLDKGKSFAVDIQLLQGTHLQAHSNTQKWWTLS